MIHKLSESKAKKKLLQSDDLLFGRSTLSPELQKVYDKIYKAVSKMDREIAFDLRKLDNVTMTDLKKTIVEIFYPMLQLDHPEIFWLDGSKILSKERDSKIVVIPTYCMSKTERDCLLDSVNKKIDKIVELYKDKSDYDFAVGVMEWLTSNVDYNDDLADDDADKSKYFKENTVYGALIKNSTICFGYACAYSLILTKKGIPCRVVLGGRKHQGDAGHAWNIAMIDGEWCHIDCTFCDYDGKYEKEFKVETNYAYFGLTDEQFTYFYNKELLFAQKLPRCNSKKNNYFIRKGLSFGNYEFTNAVDKIYETFIASGTGKKMFQVLLDLPDYKQAVLLARMALGTPVALYQTRLDVLCDSFCRQTESVFVPKITITKIIMETNFPVLTFTLDVTKVVNPYRKNPASASETQKSSTGTASAKATDAPAKSPASATSRQKPEGLDEALKYVLPSETFIPPEDLERSKRDEAADPLDKIVALIEVPTKYTFSIPFDSFTVGAGSKCDLCVYTTGVEECFVVYCDNGVWKIENKSGRSGHVFLDGKELIGSKMLRENAFIRVDGSKSYRFTLDLETWYKEKGIKGDGGYRKQFVPQEEPVKSYLYELPEQKEYIIEPAGEISVESNDSDDREFVSSLNRMIKIELDGLSCAWTIENISDNKNYVRVNGEIVERRIYLKEYDMLQFADKENVFRFIVNRKDYKRKLGQ